MGSWCVCFIIHNFFLSALFSFEWDRLSFHCTRCDLSKCLFFEKALKYFSESVFIHTFLAFLNLKSSNLLSDSVGWPNCSQFCGSVCRTATENKIFACFRNYLCKSVLLFFCLLSTSKSNLSSVTELNNLVWIYALRIWVFWWVNEEKLCTSLLAYFFSVSLYYFSQDRSKTFLAASSLSLSNLMSGLVN